MVILSFFGGLRQTEVMDLKLEKFSSSPDGVYITHERAKQRSDKRETKFLVPRSKTVEMTDYAGILENYLFAIREDLGKFSGRVFWTGRHVCYADVPMGKNIIAKIPHEMATFLKKSNSKDFTFHSFRRSSATAAADSGASAQQMIDFFGWNNVSMPQEYISTSKAAVKSMANNLISAVDNENISPNVFKSTMIAKKPEEDNKVMFPDKYEDFRLTEEAARIIQNNEKVVIINNVQGSIHM